MSEEFKYRLELIEYCDRLVELERQILNLIRPDKEVNIDSIIEVLSTITEETFNIEDYLTRR